MRLSLFISILTISSLMASTKGNSQIYSSSLHPDSDIGIKAGGNFQQIVASPFNPKYNTGFVAGIYAAKHWDKAGIRVEALLNNGQITAERPVRYGLTETRGADTTTKASFNQMYVSIPVLVEIKIKKKIFFEVGPQYNYMVSFTDNNGLYTKTYGTDKILKPGEFCLALGLTAKLPYNFTLGVRYVKGLTNVNNGSYFRAYDSWQVNTAQVTLSYRLF